MHMDIDSTTVTNALALRTDTVLPMVRHTYVTCAHDTQRLPVLTRTGSGQIRIVVTYVDTSRYRGKCHMTYTPFTICQTALNNATNEYELEQALYDYLFTSGYATTQTELWSCPTIEKKVVDPDYDQVPTEQQTAVEYWFRTAPIREQIRIHRNRSEEADTCILYTVSYIVDGIERQYIRIALEYDHKIPAALKWEVA